jgi:hypothetical protein
VGELIFNCRSPIFDWRLNIAPSASRELGKSATHRLVSRTLIDAVFRRMAYARMGTSFFNGFFQSIRCDKKPLRRLTKLREFSHWAEARR